MSDSQHIARILRIIYKLTVCVTSLLSRDTDVVQQTRCLVWRSYNCITWQNRNNILAKSTHLSTDSFYFYVELTNLQCGYLQSPLGSEATPCWPSGGNKSWPASSRRIILSGRTDDINAAGMSSTGAWRQRMMKAFPFFLFVWVMSLFEFVKYICIVRLI